jgi:Short-chain dehydrogenase involved in D-alanine esterification of lipoteichoic acid and wall teichoic acid (D-alanine transfer protein)
MKTTYNTILITVGGSGIGRGLAEAFHRLGNQVIIAGRGQKTLDETTAANPGMKSLTLDVSDAKSIQSFAEKIATDYPPLNVLINMAGIMQPENLLGAPNLSTTEKTITTNLLGPIGLTSALLPLLQKQPRATIMNVSSGLAFVPLAMTPTYCATKAAIHSYTQSLRYQLKATNVEVIELIPPYVQTTLMGDQQADDPKAMPLEEFITEVMGILQSQSDAKEICVKYVYPLRYAGEPDQKKYEQFFQQFNASMHK